MPKEGFEETLLKKYVAMKAMTWSVVDLEWTMNVLKTEKCVLMKKHGELLSCSSQTTMNSGQITDRLLEHIPSLYVGFVIDAQKSILKYCRRGIFELIRFLLELGRSLKRRSKKVEGTQFF